jgi:deferrochelatase/peroxidase EfeB
VLVARHLSRRGLLGAALESGAALSAGGAGWAAAAARPSSEGNRVVPFHAEHQAGTATEAQDRLAFAAFDVRTSDPGALRSMLAIWSAAAEQMTQGRPVGSTAPELPPVARCRRSTRARSTTSRRRGSP